MIQGYNIPNFRTLIDDFLPEEVVDGRLDPKEANNPKAAIGEKKIPLGLCSPAGMFHEAMAMLNGAEKYGAWNYREVDIKASVYLHACLRHIFLYFDGEEKAADSGVHHLGHAKACLGIWLDAIQTGNYVDDRPQSSNLGELFDMFANRHAQM
jgi:hypothetical protein